VSEAVTDEFVDRPGADRVPFDVQSPAVATAGHSHLPRFRKLSRAVLPDPESDFAAYLAAGFSLPRWLADRWLARSDRDECARLGFWFNAPPPLWLRVNRLRTDRELYRLQLAAKNLDAAPGDHPQSLRLLDGASIRELPGYAEGEFAVQDLSAMAVASALNPQPGWAVLDLCAAPGGKTTHLAELMANRGRIVACDIDRRRLDTVTTLCQRLGLTVVEPHLVGKDDTDPPAGPFDAALVDVPCSNTGVLGRRPEVRWRLRPNEFEDLIRLQTRLLLTALDRVKPGGVVVYSTCSIEPDENGGVVQAVRRAIRGLALEAEAAAVPGRPADGGYWARLRKPG
jgi:16S rRNA (cytosine967-C5)-methyltransferase